MARLRQSTIRLTGVRVCAYNVASEWNRKTWSLGRICPCEANARLHILCQSTVGIYEVHWGLTVQVNSCMPVKLLFKLVRPVRGPA